MMDNIFFYENFYKGSRPIIEIKKEPDAFIVEEITKDGRQLEINKYNGFTGGEGDFLYFVMQKKDWATDIAIKKIAKSLYLSKKRFSFAGSKDKRALTVQLACLFAGKNAKEHLIEEKLLNIKIKGIDILECYYSNKKLNIGDLKGNRFTIKINDYSRYSIKFLSEHGNVFPNYFGPQRFGETRMISHIIGYFIVKGLFKEAVMTYLTYTSNSEPQKIKEARHMLKNEQNFKEALKYFPKSLKHERTLLAHLSKYENDYVNALRHLPRQTLLMFVHALQSYIFNMQLSYKLLNGITKEENEYYCKKDALGFPLIEEKTENNGYLCMPIIGYETKTTKEQDELLANIGIKKEDFKIRSIPELSLKGSYRVCFAPFIDFKELDGNVSFKLPAGSYATIFLNEIAQIKDFKLYNIVNIKEFIKEF
ncbi:MAG: tRNA pseudouridine(13) synthase TruD [Candidatus Anstonellales archaeon]